MNRNSTFDLRMQWGSMKMISLPLLLVVLLALGGCSMGKMAVRGSMPMMEGGIESMNRETDLELARAAIPANLKMMEGMTVVDPDNAELRIRAANGFYGYAFAFVENEEPERAARLYQRCREHALAALRPASLADSLETVPIDELQHDLQKVDRSAVPALFWTASCWAKWIDLNRDDVHSISHLVRAAAMMQRVLELDEGYYYAGPHIFFGVYYGGRSPTLGGNFSRSAQHFTRARELTGGKLLLVDVFEAEYLDRQRLDQQGFHDKLTAVIAAPDDLFPDMAFANKVAKARARALLAREEEWF
jgi:hypothetical protein